MKEPRTNDSGTHISKMLYGLILCICVIAVVWMLRLASLKEIDTYTEIIIAPAAIALFVAVALAFFVAADARRLYRKLETSYGIIARSEFKFRAIVEHAGDAILIYNENTDIIEVNSHACNMLGYTRQELLSMKISQIVPSDELALQAEKIEYLKKYKHSLFERRMLRKDGSLVSTEINTQVADGTGFIAVVRDVTGRNKVQLALRESEEKYRYLFNNYPAFIIIWDIKTLRVMEVNDAVIERYGYTRQEWGNMSILDYRLGEDHERVAELAGRMLESNIEVFRKTWKHIMKSGEVLLMDIISHKIQYNGHTAVLSLARDVTEQVRIQTLLKQSEEKHRAMIDNISDAIFLMDEHAEIFYQSPSVERIVGYTLQDAQNSTVFHFIHPDDVPMAMQSFMEATGAPGKTLTYQFRVCHKQGHYIWVEGNVINLLHNENVKAYIVCYRDITDRKQAEAEINALNESLELKVTKRTAELKEANDALESFAYSVSHDLRAPLRAIHGFNTLIDEDYRAGFNDELKTLFSHIKDNTRRMNTIIDDLLALSRFEKAVLKPEQVDMQLLFEKVWGNIKVMNPNRANLKYCTLPQAQADPSLIEQVLVNLLSNAVKYSSKKETPLITLCYRQEGSMVTYSVKDNGAGFDMKYVHKLFAPFQRLHGANEFEGNGIGLLVVKRIIEKHGGKVHAEGKPGEGAIFYFSLPAAIGNAGTLPVVGPHNN